MDKKTIFSFLFAALLFTGCHEKGHTMPELPPIETTTADSSVYTGTTVDFIHVDSETVTEKKPPSVGLDFPEIDDPFDDSFYALFSSADTRISSARTEEMTSADDENVSSANARTYSSETAAVQYSEEEGVVTAAPPRFDDVTETVSAEEIGSIITESVPAVSAERFDIGEYMPREEDYPDFVF